MAGANRFSENVHERVRIAPGSNTALPYHEELVAAEKGEPLTLGQPTGTASKMLWRPN